MIHLKHSLKMLPVLLLLLGTSCKKQDTLPEAFDIRDYTIIGKRAAGNPYLIQMETGDSATMIHSSISGGAYSYTDGVLKFNFGDGEVICSFTIENGSIKAYNGPVIINTYDLVKIPATNQLSGNNFKGIWYNTAYSTEFRFSDHQVITIENNQQNTRNYTLINNLAGMIKGPGSDLSLFVWADRKLEAGRYIYPNHQWGTFMKQ